MKRKIIQVNERPPVGQSVFLSLQHMFAMFGASVLVPILLGINPAIVLLMNGIGTLIFIFITKGKAPAYLGSSFAFIMPALIVIGSAGYRYALGGFVVTGAIFCVVALIIKFFGTKWINIVLPPAAMGPVVALIGLELAGVSVGSIISDGVTAIDPHVYIVFFATLAVAIFGSILFRKFFAVIPILVAMVVGYVLAICFGMIDFGAVAQGHWFQLPNFELPLFSLSTILVIIPAAIVVIAEHIGHQLVTSKIVEKDLLEDPGLHRSLLGDGISTLLSGLVGSVPTTTYGENIGVMAITKVYSVWVIGGAAVISIILSFIGMVSGAIIAMPAAVIGGVSFLLYGMIAASGIRLMVESKIDYGNARNLALTAVVFITGLSGVSFHIGDVEFKGMILAAIVGVVLSLIFHILDKFKLTNDYEKGKA